MNLRKEREGELAMFFEVLLWGLFPIITVLSYKNVSPLISLEISTIFTVIFFGIIISARKKWHEVFNTSVYKDVFFATIFIISFYLFYYFALKYTSVGNASIVALSETFFSYLVFNVWKKEYIPKKHILGAIFMIMGALIILLPNIKAFNIGDILVLLAAAVAPFGNFLQRKARSKISSESIMFLRGCIGSIMILVFILVFNVKTSIYEIRSSMLFLLINGILIFGLSKIFWLEAIHRINVAKASALGASAPLVTLFFAWMFLKSALTSWQFLSLIPVFLGIYLLSRNNAKH